MAGNNGESGAAAPTDADGPSPRSVGFSFVEAARNTVAVIMSPSRAANMEAALQTSMAARAAAAPNASGALSAHRHSPYEDAATTAVTAPPRSDSVQATTVTPLDAEAAENQPQQGVP